MNKLLISIWVGVLFLCGVQIGLYKGRLLEKEETQYIINENTDLKKKLWMHEVAVKVIECESNGKHYGVYGDKGKSYGALQIQQATFREFATEMGRKDLNRWKFRDQLDVFFFALQNGKAKKWSCFKEE